MNNRFAVIGLNFGDEGKGLVVDYLCSQYLAYETLVVRYSGGQQAGHTVLRDNVRHTFSNFGSGALYKVPSYWSEKCTVDPVGLYNELHTLLEKGIKPILYINNKCPITTPYDIYYDEFLHNTTFGYVSCGVGYGTTLQREENHYSLLFEDLFFPKVLRMKLDLIKQYYSYLIEKDGYCKENRINEIDVNYFCDVVYFIIKSHFISKIKGEEYLSDGYRNIIYESSQGLLLDKNIGFYPYVTRSNVGCKSLDNSKDGIDVYYVTRAYTTRHGFGPWAKENIYHNIKSDENENNVTNKFQGEFKRSLLDLDLLKYSLVKDIDFRNGNNLVITCLDHVENEWRFIYENQIVYCINEKEFINSIVKILNEGSIFNKILISKSPDSRNIYDHHIN